MCAKKVTRPDPVARLVNRCNQVIPLLQRCVEDLEDPQEKASLQRQVDALSRDTAIVAGGLHTGTVKPQPEKQNELA